jgi:hypothetical protein
MIIRTANPKTKFTILKNSVLTDDRMSFRARGILAAILSRPNDWRTSSELLAMQSGGREGRDAIRTALKELEACGYLIRRKEKNPTNGQIRTNYYVFDEPQEVVDKVPENGLAVVGLSGVGIDGVFTKKQIQRNKNSLKSKKQSEKTSGGLSLSPTIPNGMTHEEYLEAPECEHGFKLFKGCPMCRAIENFGMEK